MDWISTIQKNGLEIGGYALAALSLFVIAQLKSWFTSKKFFDSKKMVNKNSNIRDLLVELRTEIDADRTKLFQFHNGDYFVSGESSMKSTLTHAVCRGGISYPETANYTAVPTSYYTRTLCELQDRGYFQVKAEDMTDEYLKHILISHNVSYAIIVPVTDTKGNWVGFLMCVWLEEKSIKNKLEEIQYSAIKIGNELLRK